MSTPTMHVSPTPTTTFIMAQTGSKTVPEQTKSSKGKGRKDKKPAPSEKKEAEVTKKLAPELREKWNQTTWRSRMLERRKEQPTMWK